MKDAPDCLSKSWLPGNNGENKIDFEKGIVKVAKVPI